MGWYEVEVPTEGREVYVIEADSPEEAVANWADGDIVVSEHFAAGDPVATERDTEDES